ncbi:hypothetical protein MMYC01_206023 [Madurella mycetomatis]|uniref:Uncharacterized protein n=1 Tax=Madurella mycetomatis TaxID=100816 RepID=A0A175W3Y8_9PEZI|nr:hypothetical protein MMYC01_206023 [Madurella mycetomatis]
MPGVTQTGTTVFAAQETNWFLGPDDGRFFVWQTTTNIAQEEWVKFRLEIDTADDTKMKLFPHDGSQALVWNLSSHNKPSLAVNDGTPNRGPEMLIKAEIFVFGDNDIKKSVTLLKAEFVEA